MKTKGDINKMKLKTLKDIEKEVYRKLDDKESFNSFKDIKQEAIKWVKYYQKIKYDEPNYAKRRIQIQWIRIFFNITEEDLEWK